MTKFTDSLETLINEMTEKNASAVNYIISSYSKNIEASDNKLVKTLDKQLSKTEKAELLKALDSTIHYVIPQVTKDVKPLDECVVDNKVRLAALKVAQRAQIEFEGRYTSIVD